MSTEWDRKMMPGFMQAAFEVCLGAAYESFTMMKDPFRGMDTFLSEAKVLLTVPSDAGDDFKSQAEALASVWMEKGARLFEQFKTTVQRFTEGA